MTESAEHDLMPITERNLRRCPSCAAFAPLFRSFLDPVGGRTIRLYECSCGERIWNDQDVRLNGDKAR